MTRVVAEGLASRFRAICRGSKSEVPYTPRLGDRRNFNTVSGDVAGVVSYGIVKNLDNGAAQQPRVALMGATPSCGEFHLHFPSDARTRRREMWMVILPRAKCCRMWR